MFLYFESGKNNQKYFHYFNAHLLKKYIFAVKFYKIINSQKKEKIMNEERKNYQLKFEGTGGEYFGIFIIFSFFCELMIL